MTFNRSIFLGKFTQEARDLIHALDETLLHLEKSPQDQESLKEMLRVAHTLKGSSKIMRVQQVSQLAHNMEEVLVGVQDGHLTLSGDVIDLLFLTTDRLRQCIESIQQHPDKTLDISQISKALDCAAQGDNIAELLAELRQDAPRSRPRESSGDLPPERAPMHPPDLRVHDNAGDDPAADLLPPSEKPRRDETIRVSVGQLDKAVRLIGEIAVSHQKSTHALALLKKLQRIASAHVKQLQHACQQASLPHLPQRMSAELLSQSTRLVKGLDQAYKDSRDESAVLDIVISELHDDVLAMRMLPLSVVFDTFPRAVRDMARYFHKEIELDMRGEGTVLDNNIIEKLNAPLIHILRNCVDHGIESPEEREAKGKSPVGTISIRASQKSGHITIEIADDGRGMQLEQLKHRAIQRGLISEEQARGLSQADAINLAFLPRLSTSEIITDISGRGVGMEIVKAEVELLKGSAHIRSTPDRGTSCVLTLPATLSSLRTLIISSRRALFAIPLNAIDETVHVASHECIDVVGQMAVRLRNQIIYLVELADVLGLKHVSATPKERYFVLIARANGKRIGLVVDDVLDERDVVVKPLPAHLRKAKTIAGATISKQNSIILILHIPEVLEQAKHLTFETREIRQNAKQDQAPRILVADDSMSTAEIEKRILESYGYEVELAHDGLEALERLTQRRYDLLVTDIEMPRMDGFTLTERARHLPEYAHLPVVIVTSLERESDRRRGLDVGANAYITKGYFEQRNFIETIRSLV